MAKLFLIPTTLSNNIDQCVLLPYQLEQIKHLKYFIVETAKIARMHLKQLTLNTPLQELDIQELNKHQKDLNSLIQPLLNGQDMGLISDCGMPAIADPGSGIVRLAHLHNITVIPFAGPNSLLMALMASGVNGQSFTFTGYLPVDSAERIVRLKQLQDLVLKYHQSQIIIEAPFRNQQLLTALIDSLSPQIILSIAINLMQTNEQIISKSIKNWKTLSELPNIHKQETVFILGV
jgi:16S rRNA (cytidine1402-2'-O)-methyltransferase